VYAPVMQKILRTAAISADMWIYVVIGAILPSIALQLFAVIMKKRKE